MLDTEQFSDSRGRKLVDLNGDKIGTIDDIYIDDETGRPEWALVNTGLFGTRSHFAPLRDASISGEDVHVPYSKDKVKDAPSVEADEALAPEEEATLYRHYGLEYGGADVSSDRGTVDDVSSDRGTVDDVSNDHGTVGNDVSGPTTDNAMTRSEEELRVGKTEHEAGRVRLRKHVETERVTETVPLRREEARIEREPITDANVDDATEGPAISEEEHEVRLTEEEAVVDKRAVPKERVRVDKDTVTEEQQVSEDVRKERIEVDEDIRR